MFHDMTSLIYPVRCSCCGRLLTGRSEWVCVGCRGTIPLTQYHLDPGNFMARRLKEICPEVEIVTAQFYYHHNSRWRRMVHDIKYFRSWYMAYRMGRSYGDQLRKAKIFQDIDIIIPIPLHPRRQISRGYNQSELIAQGMGKSLKIKVDTSAVRRKRHNISQVSTLNKDSRWGNVHGIFSVSHPERLEGKKILIIDDVFTTGATVSACIEALKSVPSCKISVATLAVSHSQIIGNT